MRERVDFEWRLRGTGIVEFNVPDLCRDWYGICSCEYFQSPIVIYDVYIPNEDKQRKGKGGGSESHGLIQIDLIVSTGNSR